MDFRFRFPAFGAVRVAAVVLAGGGGFGGWGAARAEAASQVEAAVTGVCVTGDDLEPDASQLTRLDNAGQAGLWLEQRIMPGLTVSEAPEFFATADEVFFEEAEGLWIYAYRSAETGKWIAWVALDSEQAGVVHTAAIDLGR